MHLRNVKLSKKYFANCHKNQSNFNAYHDHLRNMTEFEKNKQLGSKPGMSFQIFIYRPFEKTIY